MILLGSNGYIGQAFKRFFLENNIDFHCVLRSDFDGSNPESLVKIIKDTNSKFLINCAGYTGKPNVDACEENKFECWTSNLTLPMNISIACSSAKIPWGHVSTGCIYTGKKENGNGFTEEDKPNFSFSYDNCSYYSGVKELTERILSKINGIYFWRLRVPFEGRVNDRNYISKILNYNKLLNVENSFSQLNEFVKSCFSCWRLKIPFGIYNMTNPGFMSTKEVVDMAKKIGKIDKEFDFFESESDFMSKAAKAPRSSCVLDSSKILNCGIELKEVHESMECSMKEYFKNLNFKSL
jgi:dTDP-4-dehydrorhamnose reductase